MVKRIVPLLILCLMIASMMTSFTSPIVSSSSKEALCKFEGPDKSQYIEITNYVVYGPSNPRVGDVLVVFFTLKYIGESGQAVLDRVYVKAVLPDGSSREYEDKSFRGRTLGPGDSVRFHTEIEVSMKGSWRLWPSFEYHVSGNAYSSPSHWHECTINVAARETTTTTSTPRPLPDLSFDSQYLQPIGYSSCGGFYAHIKNIGRADLTINTTALFRIRYGNTIIEDRRVTVPALRAGEKTMIFSGPFIGIPGRDYRVTVILDYDNQVSEASESNIRSFTMRYYNFSLPVFDLEVKSLEYTGSSINFTIKHSGCIDSPSTVAHLGVKLPPYGEILELDSIVVPALSGLDEVKLSFNDLSDYIASNPELSELSSFDIHVWIDTVEVRYQVMGQEVVIKESDTLNNKRVLHVSTALIIEGPSYYFLERKQGPYSYIISNPTDRWRAVGGIPGRDITYEYEVEGCNAQILETTPHLIITLPDSCSDRSMTLRIRATSGGIVAEKDVELLFYDIREPRSRANYLYSDCLNNSSLDAEKGFVFTDDPVEIWFYPRELLLPVPYSHASGQRITYEEAEVDIVLKWQVWGSNRTYIVPSENISIDWNGPHIIFTIPNDAVFDEILEKAVQVDIILIIRTGSGQRLEYDFNDYWLHENSSLQVYLRSFNFNNTQCPSVSWMMWEIFWGYTAVNDCINDNRDYCLWPDPASYELYNRAFRRMCNYGMCFGFALASQKFYEHDVFACEYCENSKPQPFAFQRGESVCTNDICEAAGEPYCPRKMSVWTYLTYEYMWALDERNVRRGLDKFDRYRLGEDIVLETLNELRAWENLPPDEKWSNPYIIMMIPPSYDEITNAHAVLAYRVEEIDQNHVKVWVIDSNRPFQPNNSSNQDRSYIYFYCCGDDGRWNFTFTFDDGTVLSDFLYATPTDLFEGESSAITTLDALSGMSEYFDLFIELLSHLGSAPSSSSNNTSNPSLYMIYSSSDIDYLQVEDNMGRRIFDPTTGKFEKDPNKISAEIYPLLLPAPVYVFVGNGEPARISLQLQGEGDTVILSEDAERSVELEYRGTDKLNEFSINPQMIEVSGTSLKGFMITSRSISEEHPYEVVVATRPGEASLRATFREDGSLKIVNLGDKKLVFDLKFSKYDFDRNSLVGETYDGIEAEPNATLTIIPESWEHIEGGKIVIEVDEDSDGVIDREEAFEPKSVRPVARASDIYVYANETGYAKVVLDGSASYSPLNKSLTWTWRGDFLEGQEVKGERVTVTMSVGTWIVELRVSDGELESIPEIIKVYVLSENMKPSNETATLPHTSSQITSTHSTTESTKPSTEIRGFLERVLQLIENKVMLLVIGLLVLLVLVIVAYALHKR